MSFSDYPQTHSAEKHSFDETPPMSSKDGTISNQRLVLEDVFETFDTTPIASTSVAQVHLATINISKLEHIAFRHPQLDVSDTEGDKQKPSLSHEGCRSLGELLSRYEETLTTSYFTAPWFSMFAHSKPKEEDLPPSSSSFRYDWKPHSDLPKHVISVAVKVQHENINEIMMQDMKIVELFITCASYLDHRWKVCVYV
jgi:predicted unusual protein kinase regulating ubiquinone biosynthesis (AarF/ABC1/UbiB family)